MWASDVCHTLSDMKTLTMRELSRNTASVLDALERGQAFELHRHGRAVGYLTQRPPAPERKPDWQAHFAPLLQLPPEMCQSARVGRS